MTILWQDGFDIYSTQADYGMAYTVITSITARTSNGRFGGGCLEINGGQRGITRAIGSETELWISWAVLVEQVIDTDFLFTNVLSDLGNVEASLTYNSQSGVFKAYRGRFSSMLGTFSLPINSGWHWIDVRIKRDTSTGEFEVWVDEVQRLSLTGVNTAPDGGGHTYTTVCMADYAGGNSVASLVDDLFIYTGSRLGDSRIETTVPTSDASPNDGTPSTGTDHYAVVDEAQFNTSDYITMPNTSGDKEVFGHGAIVSTPTTVYSVAVKLVSQKSDAGPYALTPVVVSSSVESDGSSQQLQTSWGLQYSIFESDPNTMAAWAYANVNAADVGYKVT